MKNTPLPFQTPALKKAWPKKHFALFSDMGTGKTYMTLALAEARHRRGKLKKLLVICDTPIKGVWEVEIEKHLDHDYPINLRNFSTNCYLPTNEVALCIVLLGIEALSQGKAYNQILPWVDADTMVVIDESYSIKTPKSKRTQRCWTIGGRAMYRLILTGTPVGQGYQDYYAQFKFLHLGIIDCKNAVTFRNRYVQYGGYQMRQIIGYQNTDDLLEKIAPYCFRISKEDALPDLPPKQYNIIPIQPSPEQQNAFSLLEAEMRMEQGDDEIEVSTILERTLRFQQVAGGNFPLGEGNTKPLAGKNPKLEILLDLISKMPPDAKAIIWAQFIPEIHLLEESMTEPYAVFYGAISDEGRKSATEQFQLNPDVRFMISNRTGAKGQTWTAATYVFYYSNDFSYVNRVQSEDRCHRKGQEHPVHYYDLVLQHAKSDIAIHNAVKKKQSLADYAYEHLEEFQL